jgi:hypothetical protein
MNETEFIETANQIAASLGKKLTTNKIKNWFNNFKGGNPENFLIACITNDKSYKEKAEEYKDRLKEKILMLPDKQVFKIWTSNGWGLFELQKGNDSFILRDDEHGAVIPNAQSLEKFRYIKILNDNDIFENYKL